MLSSIRNFFSKPAGQTTTSTETKAQAVGKQESKTKPLEREVVANTRLSSDLVSHIASFLPSTDARRYATTCRFNKNSIYENPKTLQKIDFQTALQLIVDGLPDEEDEKGHKKENRILLQNILKANSNLDFLTLRGTVVNQAGDIIVDATLLEVLGEKTMKRRANSLYQFLKNWGAQTLLSIKSTHDSLKRQKKLKK